MLSSIRPMYPRESRGDGTLTRPSQEEINDGKLVGQITYSRNRRRKGLKLSTVACDNEARKKRRDPKYVMKSAYLKQKKNLTSLRLSALQAAE